MPFDFTNFCLILKAFQTLLIKTVTLDFYKEIVVYTLPLQNAGSVNY